MAKSKTPPAETAETAKSACELCHCNIGEGSRVFPVNVDGQRYCPKCFQYKVIPASDGRWSALGAAVFCPRCSHQTYVVRGGCANCNFAHVNILSP